MELQELKNIWGEYDRKLDRNLHLNMQLLRQINFDKAKSKLNGLVRFKIIEIVIYVFLMVCLVNFTIKNWQPQFVISAIILGSLLVMWFVFVIKQLAIITQLQMGYASAIAPLQRKIEQLKLYIVDYTKYSLILLPLYPVLMLIAGKAFLHIDFFEPQRRLYFLSNIAIGVVFVPLTVWLFKQLSKKNISASMSKNLLVGTGWHHANSAHDFLNEIEKFEQEA